MNIPEVTPINYTPLKVIGCFVGLMLTVGLLVNTFTTSTTSPQVAEMEANTAKLNAALDKVHSAQGN